MPRRPAPAPAPAPAALPPAAARRRFLQRGAAWGAAVMGPAAAAMGPTAAAMEPAAAAGGTGPAATSPPADALPPWRQVPGQPFSAYGQPSPHEAAAQRAIGLNFRNLDGNGAAWTPLERLEGSLTPNGLHFVRSHHGTPAIDPALHRLTVHGRVARALSFDVASLLRYPMRSRQIFLECGGNSSAGWFAEPVERPVGLVHGLVSCSEWTGVPLRLLLEEAGVDPRATWLVATGADAGALQMSLPLAKAMDDCLVALYQNGERLRPENGHPMRLIAPGWKGVVNVKWLAELEVATQPAMARNETARYTELRPSGQAEQFHFVMDTKSVITHPSHGQKLPGPGVHQVRGLAWSGHGRITRVEVSADGGRQWTDAELQGPVLPQCLTRFRLPWRWDGRPSVLQSRATDDSGRVQPSRAALVAAQGRRGFYHYHAIVSWEVDEQGFVGHVYVDA